MLIERRPVADEYAEGGRRAVLLGREVLVLSPLPSLVLGVLDGGPAPLEAVVEAAEAAYGTPPEGTVTEAVRHVVEELEGLDLVALRA